MDILNNFEVYLSHVSIFTYLLAFLGGVLMSFTPCVYPLIPITIGYIGSHSVGSKFKGLFLSIFYVLGFAVVYSLLGVGAGIAGRVFGELTQHPLSYIIVGNLCLLLGLSLFELFELPLPRFMKEKRLETKSKGFWGAFFVGMISASVASPCVTPVLGAILLFVAMKKNIVMGMSLLFVFACGMGFILILAGTFLGILVGLPRSGIWVTRVKKIFAWLLLLMSEYYFLKAGRLL
ncbi:MAG: cytochrome c biogenesis protein CcdA [Candidatus Omnitrophota bacterium]